MRYLHVLQASPGCSERIFISEISIQRSGKGKGGDSELRRRKGKEVFSLCAAGRVFAVPGSLLPPRSVGSLRAGSSPRGRQQRAVLRSLPGPAVGAPRCPPAPRVSVCLSGKAGGVDLLVFCFVFLPQERSSLRQGGEGAGGGGPGSSLPHGRCLTGSPKSPGDDGTWARPLGAAQRGARQTNRGAGSGGGGSSAQSFPCCASSRLQAGCLPPHVQRPGGRWGTLPPGGGGGGGSAGDSAGRGGRAARHREKLR